MGDSTLGWSGWYTIWVGGCGDYTAIKTSLRVSVFTSLFMGGRPLLLSISWHVSHICYSNDALHWGTGTLWLAATISEANLATALQHHHWPTTWQMQFVPALILWECTNSLLIWFQFCAAVLFVYQVNTPLPPPSRKPVGFLPKIVELGSPNTLHFENADVSRVRQFQDLYFWWCWPTTFTYGVICYVYISSAVSRYFIKQYCWIPFFDFKGMGSGCLETMCCKCCVTFIASLG